MDSVAHNWPSSINDAIPPELLGVIFDWCLSSYSTEFKGSREETSPWTLSHVCRYWRHLVHSYSHMWLSIPQVRICHAGDIDEIARIIDAAMQRSYPQLLQLSVRFDAPLGTLTKDISPTVSVLAQHFDRVASLHLRIDDINLWHLFPTQLSLPSLKKLFLVIGSSRAMNDFDIPKVFQNLATLQHLSICIVQTGHILGHTIYRLLEHRWFECMPLTTLEIHQDSNFCPIADILAWTPYLLELKLTDIECRSLLWNPITHNRLRSLHLSASGSSWAHDYRRYPKELLYSVTLPNLEDLEIVFEDHWMAFHIVHDDFMGRSQCALRRLIVPTSRGSRFFHYAGALSNIEDLSLGWVFQEDILCLGESSIGSFSPNLPKLKRLTVLRCQFTDADILEMINARQASDLVEDLTCVKIVTRGTNSITLPECHSYYTPSEQPYSHIDWIPMLSALLNLDDGRKIAKDREVRDKHLVDLLVRFAQSQTQAMLQLEHLCDELERVEVQLYPVDCYLSGTRAGYNLIRSVMKIGEVVNQYTAGNNRFSELQARFNTSLRLIIHDPFLFKHLPPNWRREPQGSKAAFSHLVYELHPHL